MPACFGRSGSVRAISMPRLHSCAVDVQTFWPLTMYSSPSSSALACSPARSEPAPGSLKSWHHASCPVRMRSSHVSFCSRLPCRAIVGRGQRVAEARRRTDRARRGDLLVHDVGERARIAEAEAVFGERGRRVSGVREALPPFRHREVGIPVLGQPRFHLGTHLLDGRFAHRTPPRVRLTRSRSTRRRLGAGAPGPGARSAPHCGDRTPRRAPHPCSGC